MVAELFAGVSAFKTLLDMLKSVKEMDDAARRNAAVIEIQEKVLEIQEKVLAGQSEQAELIDLVGKQRTRIAQLEAWDVDKERYVLTELGGGHFAYALKDSMAKGDPPHHLCAQCYTDNIKSILQSEDRQPGRCSVLTCHRCGSDIYLTGTPDPEHFKNRKRGPDFKRAGRSQA
jgi:hypothetical protein